MSNDGFWAAADELCRSSEHVVDRSARTDHPHYPGWTYPLDYGHLGGTKAGDGAEIDVWFGSASSLRVTGVLCTLDLGKLDSEVKYLWRCTESEVEGILRFYGRSSMHVLIIRR